MMCQILIQLEEAQLHNLRFEYITENIHTLNLRCTCVTRTKLSTIVYECLGKSCHLRENELQCTVSTIYSTKYGEKRIRRG